MCLELVIFRFWFIIQLFYSYFTFRIRMNLLRVGFRVGIEVGINQVEVFRCIFFRILLYFTTDFKMGMVVFGNRLLLYYQFQVFKMEELIFQGRLFFFQVKIGRSGKFFNYRYLSDLYYVYVVFRCFQYFVRVEGRMLGEKYSKFRKDVCFFFGRFLINLNKVLVSQIELEGNCFFRLRDIV